MAVITEWRPRNRAEERDEDLLSLGRRLDEFRKRFELSYRVFEKICGGPASGVTRSSLRRMVDGDATRAYVMQHRPAIINGLRAWLKSKKYRAAEIDAELATLFPEELAPLFTDEGVTYEGRAKWGERLEVFRQRHHLSYRQLHGACGGRPVIGVTRLIRLCQGGRIYEEYKASSQMVENLKGFLLKSGVPLDEARREVETIFNGEVDVMSAPRATMPVEVQRHFNLKRDPFTGDPRSKAEVFTTPQLDRVATQVEDAINYQGFLVVTGEIGSGKSLLKRRVVDTVENSQGRLRLFWPEFFNMDKVHSGSIVTFLLRRFNQVVPSDLVERADKLRRVLADANEEGTRVAIGFDECHHLHDRLLTALKNFWELGSGGYDRFLGVVLFGQPQFEGRLRDYRFREICERIEVVKMPLFDKVAYDYVAHRLRLAGGDAEKLFEREAVKLLAKQAATPLALGNLCNAALVKAYSMGERKVVTALIKSQSDEPQVRGMRRVS